MTGRCRRLGAVILIAAGATIATAAGVIAAPGRAALAPPARAIATTATAGTITPCPPDVTPACAGWQDTNAATVVQDLLLTDHNGAPIWWCNNAGGCWVGNDRLGVTGASVFDQAIYMSTTDGVHGQLVIGGHALTEQDLRFLLCLEASSLATCRAGLSAPLAAHGAVPRPPVIRRAATLRR